MGSVVVVGASMAGLLAARGLSETYDRVTVLERDALPAGAEPRRGVPQSRQLHVLLARGAEVIEELFPGFRDDLVAAGASRGDNQLDVRFYVDGHRIAPAESGIIGFGVSRPLTEHLVRQRVEQLPNVEIHDQIDVRALRADHGRVTGVLLGDGSELAADLVVDAAGRGSRAPHWLSELGFAHPPESQVRADVVYVTRHYRREPHHLDGMQGAAVLPFPGSARGGVVALEEDGRFAVVLLGLVGEDPPTDDAGMIAYAESLPIPDVADVIRSAAPLDDAVKMRYPVSVRRHFEKLDQHPEGYLVVGDALCSFNPTYGQGMSVAAMEALLLRDLVRKGESKLADRFYDAAAKVVGNAWALAAGGDLRFPEVAGHRGAVDRLLNRYLDRYRVAASVDPVLGGTFLRVASMLTPATKLMSPDHLRRVYRATRRDADAVAVRGDRVRQPRRPRGASPRRAPGRCR
jgi:2-polyprenyl-6-methoxyphenol hydroxylase-like FAD-dependent oxidoreductase